MIMGAGRRKEIPPFLATFLPGVPKSFCALVIYKSEKYEEYQQ
jgi:hypothetical protein